MAVINHSIAYGGQNMIKLSIYVELNNSIRWSQFQLKPVVILEIRRDDTCYVITVMQLETDLPKDLNIGEL